MRLPNVQAPRRPRTRFLGGTRLIRVRLWLAMLGLAVLPMVGVIYLIGSFTADEPPSGPDLHAFETATAAADFTAAARAVEARLLAVAADVDLRRLVDGVNGAKERATATKAISMLEMGDKGLIEGLCLTRMIDGTQVPINVPAGSSTGTAACGSAELVAAALAAPPGGAARETVYGTDRTRRLIIATEIMGAAKRNSGVVSAEVSLRDLFAATPSAAGIGASALLVDMDTNNIIAGARTDAAISGTVEGTRPLGNLRVRIDGIVSGHEGMVDALADAGWAATAAPLFATDDGAEFGLIHLWPAAREASTNPLLFVLIGFALIVVLVTSVVARTFLQPFDDLAESQAQLEVLYREAREDSLHDGLTGLGNHRSFQEELDRQIDLFRRHQVPVALLLIDLDDLKVVNDNEGHPAGDQLLLGMANAIRDTLRYGDRAFRIGGDEFAVLLPHTDADEASVAANRLRHFCLRPAAGERVIPFSGGISAVPQLANDRNELFRQADAALYRCKRGGRGTVAIFDADRDLAPEVAHGEVPATAVRDIIRARNLKPVYQPIVDLSDGSVLGFEGLIRPGESSSFSNPGQLFAAAAAAGRTVELDLACFEAVAAGAVQIDPQQVLSINLSPQTLEMEDFAASWLLEILARYEISPGRVIVELTEREAITDLDRLRRSVASLQRAGLRLAADDVGAGNAGLRLLSQVRFDIMKIDLSLVQDGAQHDSSRAVVRSLMDLAARQGAVAIAEGLETAEQLRSLRELGITTGQGYLLGRPGPNTGLAAVDIETLASGTIIVGQATSASASVPSQTPTAPSPLTPPPPSAGGEAPGSDALGSTPA